MKIKDLRAQLAALDTKHDDDELYIVQGDDVLSFTSDEIMTVEAYANYAFYESHTTRFIEWYKDKSFLLLSIEN